MTARRRYAVLPRLGLRPGLAETVATRLDAAFAEHAAATVDVLDAGCGRRSALTGYRQRIRRFVGIDIHPPRAGALPHLDAFELVDVCGDPSAIDANSFDIVLSSFTVEHFADPARAFANLRQWLRPTGRIVLTTVNRRHPFVALYLSIPKWLQRRAQPLLKASAADAHPLVGICNDPARLRAGLEAAGFVDVRVVSVPHLAHAWGRRLPFFMLGVLGDLLAQPFSSRRSTLVADARVPA